jgi:hypothetical protein
MLRTNFLYTETITQNVGSIFHYHVKCKLHLANLYQTEIIHKNSVQVPPV